tara:strand:+ start:6584 stop:6760 length:177 start_codon:yes stop_codon:yes gene_type:complete
MNVTRTFFVKLDVNLEDTPDLTHVASSISEELTDAGFSVVAVDIRSDIEQDIPTVLGS